MNSINNSNDVQTNKQKCGRLKYYITFGIVLLFFLALPAGVFDFLSDTSLGWITDIGDATVSEADAVYFGSGYYIGTKTINGRNHYCFYVGNFNELQAVCSMNQWWKTTVAVYARYGPSSNFSVATTLAADQWIVSCGNVENTKWVRYYDYTTGRYLFVSKNNLTPSTDSTAVCAVLSSDIGYPTIGSPGAPGDTTGNYNSFNYLDIKKYGYINGVTILLNNHSIFIPDGYSKTPINIDHPGKVYFGTTDTGLGNFVGHYGSPGSTTQLPVTVSNVKTGADDNGTYNFTNGYFLSGIKTTNIYGEVTFASGNMKITATAGDSNIHAYALSFASKFIITGGRIESRINAGGDPTAVAIQIGGEATGGDDCTQEMARFSGGTVIAQGNIHGIYVRGKMYIENNVNIVSEACMHQSYYDPVKSGDAIKVSNSLTFAPSFCGSITATSTYGRAISTMFGDLEIFGSGNITASGRIFGICSGVSTDNSTAYNIKINTTGGTIIATATGVIGTGKYGQDLNSRSVGIHSDGKVIIDTAPECTIIATGTKKTEDVKADKKRTTLYVGANSTKICAAGIYGGEISIIHCGTIIARGNGGSATTVMINNNYVYNVFYGTYGMRAMNTAHPSTPLSGKIIISGVGGNIYACGEIHGMSADNAIEITGTGTANRISSVSNGSEDYGTNLSGYGIYAGTTIYVNTSDSISASPTYYQSIGGSNIRSMPSASSTAVGSVETNGKFAAYGFINDLSEPNGSNRWALISYYNAANQKVYDGYVAISAANGTAYCVKDTSIVALPNLSMNKKCGIYSGGSMTLKLGDSTSNLSVFSGSEFAIQSKGNLTISGGIIQAFVSSDIPNAVAIQAGESDDTAIGNTIQVNVTGGNITANGNRHGFYIRGTLTVTNNSIIQTNACRQLHYYDETLSGDGIKVSGRLIITDQFSGLIDAYSKYGRAISSQDINNDIEIRGTGKIIARGRLYGLRSDCGIKFFGSEVVAEATGIAEGTLNGRSVGIYATSSIEFNTNYNVTAVGNKDAAYFAADINAGGIRAFDINVIKCGVLTAVGSGSNMALNYGIYADNYVYIHTDTNASTIIANGATSGIYCKNANNSDFIISGNQTKFAVTGAANVFAGGTLEVETTGVASISSDRYIYKKGESIQFDYDGSLGYNINAGNTNNWFAFFPLGITEPADLKAYYVANSSNILWGYARDYLLNGSITVSGSNLNPGCYRLCLLDYSPSCSVSGYNLIDSIIIIVLPEKIDISAPQAQCIRGIDVPLGSVTVAGSGNVVFKGSERGMNAGENVYVSGSGNTYGIAAQRGIFAKNVSISGSGNLTAIATGANTSIAGITAYPGKAEYSGSGKLTVKSGNATSGNNFAVYGESGVELKGTGDVNISVENGVNMSVAGIHSNGSIVLGGTNGVLINASTQSNTAQTGGLWAPVVTISTTVKNIDITATNTAGGEVIAVYATNNLSVDGNAASNKLTARGVGSASYGFKANNSITISGTRTIDASASAGTAIYSGNAVFIATEATKNNAQGIITATGGLGAIHGGNVYIYGKSGNITATANRTNAKVINATDNLSIITERNVSAISTGNDSIAINAATVNIGTAATKSNTHGKVTATALKKAVNATAVNIYGASGDITLTAKGNGGRAVEGNNIVIEANRKIEAKVNAASSDTRGIYAKNALSITNSVNVNASSASSEGSAIYSDKNITITSSTVNANVSGSAAKYGIYCGSGTLNINSGTNNLSTTLKSFAGRNVASATGIYSNNELVIDGGSYLSTRSHCVVEADGYYGTYSSLKYTVNGNATVSSLGEIGIRTANNCSVVIAPTAIVRTDKTSSVENSSIYYENGTQVTPKNSDGANVYLIRLYQATRGSSGSIYGVTTMQANDTALYYSISGYCDLAGNYVRAKTYYGPGYTDNDTYVYIYLPEGACIAKSVDYPSGTLYKEYSLSYYTMLKANGAGNPSIGGTIPANEKELMLVYSPNRNYSNQTLFSKYSNISGNAAKEFFTSPGVTSVDKSILHITIYPSECTRIYAFEIYKGGSKITTITGNTNNKYADASGIFTHAGLKEYIEKYASGNIEVKMVANAWAFDKIEIKSGVTVDLKSDDSKVLTRAVIADLSDSFVSPGTGNQSELSYTYEKDGKTYSVMKNDSKENVQFTDKTDVFFYVLGNLNIQGVTFDHATIGNDRFTTN